MRTRLLLATGLAALASTALTACTAGAPTDGLDGALASVPATEENLAMIAWTDVSAVSELGGYDTVPHPFNTAGMLGYGAFASVREVLDPALLPATGSDDAAALWTGRPPHVAFRFDGVDAGAVEEFFAEADGERSDRAEGTLLVRRGDGETNLEDELVPPPVINQMNTVWFGEGTFIGSSQQAMVVDLAEGTGESAAESEVYAGVIDCVGDVVAAELHTGEAAAPATSLAVGFGGTAEEAVATLCLRAGDPAAVAESVREQLASGTDPRSMQTWQEILGDGEVEESGDWVQVRFTDPPAPDTIHRVLHARGIPALMGEAG
ncbi:hypothetical protein LQF12_00520 [Ruania suaedae]|uniref:hypothetical protein n=1 Tax=Ruania suaedae TaxID=2897774 RepID=UPI001E3EF297|nr:hypothetical protein [Ruania suaedae]UFU03132.1 hypothetical protein LQF12_00520 [Ruania suaedae]